MARTFLSWFIEKHFEKTCCLEPVIYLDFIKSFPSLGIKGALLLTDSFQYLVYAFSNRQHLRVVLKQSEHLYRIFSGACPEVKPLVLFPLFYL
ncbi:hypothetical protein Mal35_07540 [Gimesia maris]|nr:hypothetical protein Mal35_07540 [Gimesia maris]